MKLFLPDHSIVTRWILIFQHPHKKHRSWFVCFHLLAKSTSISSSLKGPKGFLLIIWYQWSVYFYFNFPTVTVIKFYSCIINLFTFFFYQKLIYTKMCTVTVNFMTAFQHKLCLTTQHWDGDHLQGSHFKLNNGQ